MRQENIITSLSLLTFVAISDEFGEERMLTASQDARNSMLTPSAFLECYSQDIYASNIYGSLPISDQGVDRNVL
jgi:hypothetical protein